MKFQKFLFFSFLFFAIVIFFLNFFNFQKENSPITPLDKMFGIQKTLKKETSILLTGDIMLGRSVMTKSVKLNNPHYPFKKVSGELQKADIVFSNLENPIISVCPQTDKGFKFCTSQFMLEGLVFSGIDIVTLANNHTRNYGSQGFEETKQFLDQNKIKWVGEDNLEIIEKNNIKFGFLGFDFLSYTPKEKDYNFVEKSKNQVDILIVGIHWGVEYQEIPTAKQREIAKILVEKGADVVAGHHPHWVQQIEYIEGKPVYYSLGNFVFDQMWSEETKKGLVMKLTFREEKLIREEKLPIYMSEFAQPEWVKQ